MPVSTRTTPSPAASAHALPCGTPGQGSGRRRRQTPGSTRSPRPSSRRRVGVAMRGRLPVRLEARRFAPMASTEETEQTETEEVSEKTKPKGGKAVTAKVAREYFNAVINERDFSAYDRLWTSDGEWQVNGLHDEPLSPAG